MSNITNANQQLICKISPNGTKYWYLNDQRHRVDGPAIEYVNGEKHWYLNGKLHCVDGPAVEYVNGNKHWYLNNISYPPPPTKYPLLPIGTLVTIDGKLGLIYDTNTYIYHIYLEGSQVVRFKWDEKVKKQRR